MIIDALKNTKGNGTLAAKALNTTPRKFSYKAQRYGIDYQKFR
jgi:Nif-specific regulatory protein